jgi:hypothetical protein
VSSVIAAAACFAMAIRKKNIHNFRVNFSVSIVSSPHVRLNGYVRGLFIHTWTQVYKKFGRELCVVVTNVSEGTTEYCHHKTTPDLPVVDAVRMTLATPGDGEFPHAVYSIPV